MKKLVPTVEECRRMKQSGLETEAEQQAWLQGFRNLKSPPMKPREVLPPLSNIVTAEDTADLDAWLAKEFPTVEERCAFLMGKLNIVGGIAR